MGEEAQDHGRAEKALRESEQMYRDLFEKSCDAIITLSPPSWTFYVCNQAALDLFHVKSWEECSSLGIADISPPLQPDGKESAEKIREMIDIALQNGSHLFQWTIKRLNGHSFPSTILLTRMNLGNITYLQTTIRDITKEKQAEDEIRLLNQSLMMATNASQFGIWDMDLVTDHLTWDDAMFRLYHLSHKEFNSTTDSWISNIHPDDKARIREELDSAIQEKKPLDAEFRIVWPDDSIRFIRACAHVLIDSDGSSVRMVGIQFDITDKKLYEWEVTQYAEQLGIKNLELEELSDELARLNQELDQKVRERTIELEEANRVLKQMDVLKSQFISIASHELRTPLIAMKGYLNLLLEGTRWNAAEDHHRIIEIISRNADRLSRIVSEILDISRIEENKLVLLQDWFYINSTIKEVAEELTLSLEKRGQTLNLELNDNLPQYFGDRDRITQVFINLLDNAIKFTPDKGTITIRTYLDQNSLVCEVEDTGIGIDPKDISQVFTRFFQVRDITTHRSGKDEFLAGGTGLGLSIVKGIIEAHQGTVSATSTPGKGTVFQLKLPLQEQPSQPDRTGTKNSECSLVQDVKQKDVPSYEQGRSQIVILLVDEELEIKEVLHDLLSPSYSFLTAHTGATALKMAYASHPDLIILNVDIPGIMGRNIYNILKKNPKTYDIPIILLIPETNVNFLHETEISEDDQYVKTPLDYSVLQPLIMKAVDR